MLSHLHLLVCSAQEMKKESTLFTIRGSLECFPSYLLTRLLEWFCLLALGWFVFRVNASLLSNLDDEISWRTLTPAVLFNIFALVCLLALLVVADSTKLHSVVLWIDDVRFKARVKRGVLMVRDHLMPLLVGRFLRLCLVVLVSGALWLMNRTAQFNWWSVAIFSQLGIYLTLSFEAWWYRKLCTYAFRALK